MASILIPPLLETQGCCNDEFQVPASSLLSQILTFVSTETLLTRSSMDRCASDFHPPIHPAHRLVSLEALSSETASLLRLLVFMRELMGKFRGKGTQEVERSLLPNRTCVVRLVEDHGRRVH